MSRTLPARAGYIAPALAFLAFVLLTGLWAVGGTAAYKAILWTFGMMKPAHPFLDTHAILSAVECHAAGVDVMRANPCDSLGRPHIYGALWLRLSALRLDRSMVVPVGVGLDLAFLAGLLLLPRAHRWHEVFVLSLAFVSPVTVFAMERGNNDIVIWLLTFAAARLAIGNGVARGVAYGVVCLASLLKFYPAVLLILLGRERLGRALLIGLPLAGLLGILIWREAATPGQHFDYAAYRTDAFGAGNVAQVLLINMTNAPWRSTLVGLIVAALTIYALTLSVRMVTRFTLLPRVRALPAFEAWLAMAGATMLIACFFLTGPNIVYRGILLLLVLPAVLTLWRNADDRPARRLLAGVAWVIVWCLWSEGVHNHVMDGTRGLDNLTEPQLALIGVVTGIRELAWWWLISVLIALVGCIGLTSAAGRDFCRLTGIRLPT